MAATALDKATCLAFPGGPDDRPDLLRGVKQAVSRILGSSSDANDAAQEAAIKICLLRDQFDPARMTMERWARMVARCATLDYCRRSGRYQRMFSDERDPDALSRDPDPEVTLEDLAQYLRAEVFAALDLEFRVVLDLWADGYSVRQTAERLGICEGTVKSRRNRGIKMARAFIAARKRRFGT